MMFGLFGIMFENEKETKKNPTNAFADRRIGSYIRFSFVFFCTIHFRLKMVSTAGCHIMR